MNSRQWTKGLLVSFVSAGLIAGCSGNNAGNAGGAAAPESTDPNAPTSITIVRGKDPRNLPVEEMLWYKKYSEIAPKNVTIKWEEIPNESVDEKTNLMLAGNNLPEAFLGTMSVGKVMKNVKSGIFLPIEDYIDDMPYFSKVLEQRPEYRALITAPDGHIYGLPYIEEMFGLITNQGILSIYKPWLDQLGLPVPTTIDEYRDTLKQFVENDMNGNGLKDEIGLALANKGANSGIGSWRNNADFGQFFGLWGQMDRGDSMFLDENGKIFNTASTEAYKTGIRYLHDMYKDGLIDPEFTITDGPKLQAKLRNKTVTVGSVVHFSVLDVAGEKVANDYVPIPYLKGPGGEYGGRENLVEMHNPLAFVLTTKTKNPRAVLAWVDSMYAPEWSVQTNWGPLGYQYKKNDKGVMVFDTLKDGLDTYNDMRVRNTIAGNSPVAILKEYYDTVVEYPQDAQDILNDMKTVGYLDKHLGDPYIPHTLFYDADTADRMALLSPQIYGLIDTSRKKWITDGGVDKEWDAYLKELEKAGLPEFIGYVQEAYDRYQANQQQ
ncbi:extracellular solute-binding protein [Paenibacillus sp. FSL K6-1096]|uniref:extracellular solute-binding protein n=1 Tax=Paenibacillus sp. FSL K6-1096 TaxID=2921460 RepID=UPI0030EF10EB